MSTPFQALVTEQEFIWQHKLLLATVIMADQCTLFCAKWTWVPGAAPNRHVCVHLGFCGVV